MASDSFLGMVVRYYRHALPHNVPTRAADIVRAAEQPGLRPRTLRRIIERTHPGLALEPAAVGFDPPRVFYAERRSVRMRERKAERLRRGLNAELGLVR